MRTNDGNLAAATAALAAVTEKCCASCGVTEIDDVKLKPCPKCDDCEERYCEKNEAISKAAAAEMYDELLFKQPESNHFGDCPICFLPMPHDVNVESVIMQACCGKFLCVGCQYANDKRMINERLKEHRCPFCRHLEPQTREDADKLLIERAELNDPFALQQLGALNYERGDYGEAFRNFTKAAALNDGESMFRLAGMYHDGKGVEKDMVEVNVLLEKAAIAGHPLARHNLGCYEQRNGRIDRAVLHWIIASNLGADPSLKALKECYKAGHVSKDDFAAALRGYQAAVDAMKSPQREAAKKYYDSIR